MAASPYEFYYDYSYSGMDSALEGVGGFLLVFILLFYFLTFAFAILTYVLHALGMYAIAKRRGIRNPWLSWIPVGDVWILGSIADQYQYVAKNRVRNRRKVLLGLTLGMWSTILLVFTGAALLGVGSVTDDALAGAGAAIMLLAYLAMVVMAVIVAVFQYIAYYDLFSSCDPGSAVLYLVLSIFLGVVLPFFVFSSRKKDLGMRPPKPVQPQMIPQPAPYMPPQPAPYMPPQAGYVPPQGYNQVPPVPPVQNQDPNQNHY